MLRFHFQRHVDESGISGTGRVAEGVLFSNGLIALTWLTPDTSVSVYKDMKAVRAIHSHGGKTEIVWDEPLCSNCGHLWTMHAGDNCGVCVHCYIDHTPESAACKCVLMEHPEYTPVDKWKPSTITSTGRALEPEQPT